MAASCKKCGRTVGCSCELTKGYCSTCWAQISKNIKTETNRTLYIKSIYYDFFNSNYNK